MSRIAGYQDQAYIRGKAPMTKREIRILTISLLGVEASDQVVDIGAGTGGLTMEAAYAANQGQVYAIEYKDDALALIKENKKVFKADNVKIIRGKAPQALGEIEGKVDRVIIGGSGGQLQALLTWCQENINPGGRVIANFISLENASQAIQAMKKIFNHVELIQVGISRGQEIGSLTMLKAANPIFMISADI